MCLGVHFSFTSLEKDFSRLSYVYRVILFPWKSKACAITTETMALIKDFVKDMMPTDKLFDISCHSSDMIRKDCRNAGIKITNHKGKVKFHSLRHSLATHLVSKGVPPNVVQKIMRHSDIKTTMKYYTHLLRGAEDNAIDKLRGFGEKRAKEQTA